MRRELGVIGGVVLRYDVGYRKTKGLAITRQLFLSFFLLSSCAATSQSVNIPTVNHQDVEKFVEAEGWRILRVTENADKAYLYQFHLANFNQAGPDFQNTVGVSLGNYQIYIDYDLARASQLNQDTRWFLRIVLAHEIAHDVAGHKPNQEALVGIFNLTQTTGRVMSNVPGAIGWAGVAVSWVASLLGKASVHLYARSQESEADRLGIEYWKRLGWDCNHWVVYYQAQVARGFEGDFEHPTQERLGQAKELCSAQKSTPEMQIVSGESLESRQRGTSPTEGGGGVATTAEQAAQAAAMAAINKMWPSLFGDGSNQLDKGASPSRRLEEAKKETSPSSVESIPSPERAPVIAVALFRNYSSTYLPEMHQGFVDALVWELKNSAKFHVLDRAVSKPPLSGITLGSFIFEPWVKIGATGLVAGSFTIQDESLVVELRLFDVTQRRQIVAKTYTGKIRDSACIAHRFAGEISLQYTGQPLRDQMRC